MSTPTIGIIVCSQRVPRAGLQITQFVLDTIQKAYPTANLRLIDLATWNLPMYDEPGIPSLITSSDGYTHELTRKWSEEIASHAGFIFVTPQYNWGYPASIKNAIDYLFHEWKGKPGMIVSYGGHGGGKAAQQLYQVLQGLRMQPVEPLVALMFPTKEFTGRAARGVDLGVMEDEGIWKEEREQILTAFQVLAQCVDARIRHVKCDEHQPECLQCVKTGRKCDGYDPNQTNPQAQKRAIVDSIPEAWTKPSTDHRLVLRPGTREERQYVEFFCTRTSRALSGFFDSDLWRYFLPQLSHSEAAVRHAAVALGALHQHVHVVLSKERCDPREKISAQNQQFVIQQYNSAIRHLVAQMSSANQVPHLTLITCCLFVCVEILSGQLKKALDHIEAGLKILQRWENETDGRLQSEGITEELTYMVVRWNIQLSMHGRKMIPLNLRQPDEAQSLGKQECWSDISTARYSLDVLINRTMSFVEAVGIDRKTRGSAWQVRRQQALLQDLDAWLCAFDRLLKRCGRRLKQIDPRGPVLLRIHHRTTRIWLDASLSRDELIFDQLEDDFRAILAYAEELIELNASLDKDALLTVFSLETGLISSLCYTASKCRNPLLRRKAINLLYRGPQKEGLWSMHQHAIIARIIVQIEEAEVAHLPLEQRIPEDRHRVYTARIENRDCRSCQLVLISMPEAADGEWHCRVRNVDFTQIQGGVPNVSTGSGISSEI
ncbi:uncharacterized protein CDV56_103603 [Aspergillus thermomutatus]|uniref:Zn(2)-C6 fungal-type domain-containing protein n=1 Tax=Aspergillus thermomutatus TaxID=41047 RepID=A0A397H4K1_ASPTH|nr:uncharacterized protein CDV56_103603 [Aspergillus thermomutatus]RHZ57991.1 hypothetical protein CDV56_103603 [Aspergillus thermomutatus]